MTGPKIEFEHDGETYGGEIMRIKSTTFGTEDHGIVTAYLHCEGNGSGIGVGGYCLDSPEKGDDGRTQRIGTAFGLDHLLRLMDAVGVSKWESLPGRDVIVLFEGRSLWGGTAAGIAGLLNGKVLILKDHAESWREREQVAS